MDGQVFVAPGDITQLAAHAVAYSTSTQLGGFGAMYPAFRDHIPGFAAWFEDLGVGHAYGCGIGDTFWMPLRPDVRPHGVVVVAATGGPATSEDKAAIAVRAAIDEAVRRLRVEAGRSERLLIALPAFRLGWGGDRDSRLRSAKAQVAAARDALAWHPGVDAAFVTYVPALYHVFLEARRRVLGGPPPGPAPDPALERALADGECVLFVGAGLSRGAGLPDWGELVARLACELGVRPHDGLDYLDMAQWHRERFGAEALAEVVRSTFGDPAQAPRPTLAHYLLMALPARYVVTTNYDDLLERALTALKRHPVKVVRQEDVARTGRGDGVCVVKLHGDASEPGAIVLCRDDYDEFFERRPALALLLEGLLLNQTFFFVGYGLRDPNFRQVYGRVARMLREAQRPAYATSFESAGEAGPYVARQWQAKRLHLVGIPGTGPEEREHHLLRFLDRLAERVAVGRPRLLLAPDVEVPGPLERLRDLMRGVGEELAGLCRRGPDVPDEGQDVSLLAEVLGLLARHGWRPPRECATGLCQLWEHLAARATGAPQRRRLLIAALEAAEGSDEVLRIRDHLAALEASPVPDQREDRDAEPDAP